jgi:hypothetical protein
MTTLRERMEAGAGIEPANAVTLQELGLDEVVRQEWQETQRDGQLRGHVLTLLNTRGAFCGL